MEHAGDVLADMLGQRIVVLHQRREIDLAVGERAEHRLGQRRHHIGQPGDGLGFAPRWPWSSG